MHWSTCCAPPWWATGRPRRHGLTRAIAVLPADHPLRGVAIGQAAALLADRYLLEGRIDDVAAADLIAQELVRAASAGADDGSGPFLRCVAALCRVVRAGRLGDLHALEEEAGALRKALTGLPGHHRRRPMTTFDAEDAAARCRTCVQ